MPEPVARESDPALLPVREARRLAVAAVAEGAVLVELTPETAVPETLRSLVPPGAVVTAFETIEYLQDFADVVETLIELSAEREATVVLALPNHRVAPVAPGARTTWDPGALAELRSMLPEGHVLLHQLALEGSTIAPADGVAATHELDVEVDPKATPLAFVVAFGPRAAELELGAVVVVQADLRAERAARAALESELALLRAKVAALEARAA